MQPILYKDYIETILHTRMDSYVSLVSPGPCVSLDSDWQNRTIHHQKGKPLTLPLHLRVFRGVDGLPLGEDVQRHSPQSVALFRCIVTYCQTHDEPLPSVSAIICHFCALSR